MNLKLSGKYILLLYISIISLYLLLIYTPYPLIFGVFGVLIICGVILYYDFQKENEQTHPFYYMVFIIIGCVFFSLFISLSPKGIIGNTSNQTEGVQGIVSTIYDEGEKNEDGLNIPYEEKIYIPSTFKMVYYVETARSDFSFYINLSCTASFEKVEVLFYSATDTVARSQGHLGTKELMNSTFISILNYYLGREEVCWSGNVQAYSQTPINFLHIQIIGYLNESYYLSHEKPTGCKTELEIYSLIYVEKELWGGTTEAELEISEYYTPSADGKGFYMFVGLLFLTIYITSFVFSIATQNMSLSRNVLIILLMISLAILILTLTNADEQFEPIKNLIKLIRDANVVWGSAFIGILKIIAIIIQFFIWTTTIGICVGICGLVQVKIESLLMKSQMA